MENASETVAPVTRLLNQSAIKEHALKCSKTLRAGYFNRVGSDFIEAVQSDAENLIKEICAKYQPGVHEVVPSEPGAQFVTGAFIAKAKDILNAAVPRIIQARVQRHPSVGKTLKR